MASFIRYKDKVTGREFKLEWKVDFPNAASARIAFDRFWRNAEFLEYAPWDEAMHGGIRYPVPIQNVQFATKHPHLYGFDPKKRSVLISLKPIEHKLILKGA